MAQRGGMEGPQAALSPGYLMGPRAQRGQRLDRLRSAGNGGTRRATARSGHRGRPHLQLSTVYCAAAPGRSGHCRIRRLSMPQPCCRAGAHQPELVKRRRPQAVDKAADVGDGLLDLAFQASKEALGLAGRYGPWCWPRAGSAVVVCTAWRRPAGPGRRAAAGRPGSTPLPWPSRRQPSCPPSRPGQHSGLRRHRYARASGSIRNRSLADRWYWGNGGSEPTVRTGGKDAMEHGFAASKTDTSRAAPSPDVERPPGWQGQPHRPTRKPSAM